MEQFGGFHNPGATRLGKIQGFLMATIAIFSGEFRRLDWGLVLLAGWSHRQEAPKIFPLLPLLLGLPTVVLGRLFLLWPGHDRCGAFR